MTLHISSLIRILTCVCLGQGEREERRMEGKGERGGWKREGEGDSLLLHPGTISFPGHSLNSFIEYKFKLFALTHY